MLMSLIDSAGFYCSVAYICKKCTCSRSRCTFDQMGVTNELWEVPGGTHFYPASSLVHKGGEPAVTSHLEPVIVDFLYRLLRLSELS
jgi:hypothetical protein